MGEYIFNNEEKTYVNKFDSYPSYLVKYIEAFGISKEDNCFCGSVYYYRRDRLYAIVEDDFIYLSPSENSIGNVYATIAKNGNFISLKNGIWNLSITWDCNGSLHLSGNRSVDYAIKVQQDQLGNVLISIFNFDKELGRVMICVGEKHDTPQSYIEELGERSYSGCDVIAKIINAMFKDPHVLSYLTELMQRMPEDIDATCDERIEELTKNCETRKAETKAEYERTLAELDNELARQIAALLEYKAACKASIGEKGEGVK